MLGFFAFLEEEVVLKMARHDVHDDDARINGTRIKDLLCHVHACGVRAC